MSVELWRGGGKKVNVRLARKSGGIDETLNGSKRICS